MHRAAASIGVDLSSAVGPVAPVRATPYRDRGAWPLPRRARAVLLLGLEHRDGVPVRVLEPGQAADAGDVTTWSIVVNDSVSYSSSTTPFATRAETSLAMSVDQKRTWLQLAEPRQRPCARGGGLGR